MRETLPRNRYTIRIKIFAYRKLFSNGHVFSWCGKKEWTACLKNSLMWFICWLWRRRRCINLWVPLLPIKIYCSLSVCAVHCDGLCFNFYASFTFFSHFVCQSLGESVHSIQKIIFLHMDPFIANNFVIYIIFFYSSVYTFRFLYPTT